MPTIPRLSKTQKAINFTLTLCILFQGTEQANVTYLMRYSRNTTLKQHPVIRVPIASAASQDTIVQGLVKIIARVQVRFIICHFKIQ